MIPVIDFTQENVLDRLEESLEGCRKHGLTPTRIVAGTDALDVLRAAVRHQIAKVGVERGGDISFRPLPKPKPGETHTGVAFQRIPIEVDMDFAPGQLSICA